MPMADPIRPPGLLPHFSFARFIWPLLGAAWVAALAVHQSPFLHWSHAPRAAWLLQWLAYLPPGMMLAVGFRWLISRAPEAATASKNVVYLSRLDHLRFFAAGLVVMYHFYHGLIPLDRRSDRWLLNLCNDGSYGVDLFFVLSGFIFGFIGDGKAIHYGNFLYSRLFRIFPLYLLGILICVAANPGRFSPMDIALLIVPVVDVGVMPGLPGYGQLWTIGLEFQFYLLFPFLMRFANRHGPGYLAGLIVLALALRGYYFWENGSARDLGQWTMVGRFDEFALGMLAAGLYRRRPQLFESPLHLLAAVAAMLGTFKWSSQWGGYQLGEKSVMWIGWPTIQGLMWAYLGLSYLSCRVRIPAFVDTTLSQLGKLSFSIYVFHTYALVWTLRRVGGGALTTDPEINAALMGLAVCLPLAVLIALPSYHLIEKQFFEMRRKYVSPLLPASDGADGVIQPGTAR